MKEYKLTDTEKQYMFDMLKKQVKKAKVWSESPVYEYLIQCREGLRLGIVVKEKETLFRKALKKENKNV